MDFDDRLRRLDTTLDCDGRTDRHFATW